MKVLSENHSNNNMSNENNSTSSNNNHNTTNWLGFSLDLSPHMNLEVTSSGCSSTLSPCFDVNNNGTSARENGVGFVASSPLTVMPLKSDGSLCIMEALTRSQLPQVPKLENFLGGETTMALSLDSRQHHSQHHHQQQHLDAYFSLLSSQGLYHMADQEGLFFRNWDQQQQQNYHHNNNSNNDNGCGYGSVGGGCYGHGNLHSLSLSMSPGSHSQSSCVTVARQISPPESGCGHYASVVETSKKRGIDKVVNQHKQTVHRKSIDTFGQRTSQYRGVTKHRWTGRYEAHLWDNSCKKEGQTRKGRQVYLGGYDMEEKAARSYDLAALKYWGLSTHTNFPIENYKEEIEEMKNMTRQEYVAHLRRKSSGFSRGASMYRGVTRHHQHGRWQARIGRVAGNKDLYLGTFSTQEEAAEAYDVAAIKFRGLNAVTNFDISRYDVEKIMASNALLAGEQAKRNKLESIEQATERSSLADHNNIVGDSISSIANDENIGQEWKMMLYHSHDEQPSYGNASFSDLFGLETASPTQPMGEDSPKLGSAHLSNSSSLVTSLNSSREGSPDHRNGSSSSPLAGPSSVVNPWIPSAQLRPAVAAIPVAHLPVFAAWGDA